MSKKEEKAAYQKEYYKNNKERLKEQQRNRNKTAEGKAYQKEYNEKNPKSKKQRNLEYTRRHSKRITLEYKYKRLQESSKRRSKKLNLTFKDYKEILKDRICHYCTRDISNIGGSSLDRVDNAKGYEKDNVVPCCKECNTIKNSWFTKEQMEQIGRYIKRKGFYEDTV